MNQNYTDLMGVDLDSSMVEFLTSCDFSLPVASLSDISSSLSYVDSSLFVTPLSDNSSSLSYVDPSLPVSPLSDNSSSLSYVDPSLFVAPLSDTASLPSYEDHLIYEPAMSQDSLPRDNDNTVLCNAFDLFYHNYRIEEGTGPNTGYPEYITRHVPANHTIQNIAPALSSQIPASVLSGAYKIKVDFEPNCMDDRYCKWTSHEKETGRRVVKFSADVMGYNSGENVKKIRVNCVPVIDCRLLPDHLNNSHECYITCIHTSYMKSSYITSSDILRLLEFILSAKFSQGQKTRMRRNIQSLKPAAITRHTHQDLFKTIISFQRPVALHTRKEINIFPWETVQRAIEKLSTRYASLGSV